MPVTVDRCPPEEWATMADIFMEMDEHYYGEASIQEPLLKEYLRTRVFNPLSGTLIIRAGSDTQIVGLACCSILYPSHRYRGQLHIKELFVSQRARGQGTGQRIMRFLAELALEQDCIALSWNAETANVQAHRFYQALGGKINERIVHYSLQGEHLRKLAGAEPVKYR